MTQAAAIWNSTSILNTQLLLTIIKLSQSIIIQSLRQCPWLCCEDARIMDSVLSWEHQILAINQLLLVTNQPYSMPSYAGCPRPKDAPTMVRTQAKDQNPRSTKDSRNRMGTMEYMQLQIANVYQMTNWQSNMECLTNPFGKCPAAKNRPFLPCNRNKNGQMKKIAWRHGCYDSTSKSCLGVSPGPVHDAETTLNRMMPRKDNNTGVLRPVPRATNIDMCKDYQRFTTTKHIII